MICLPSRSLQRLLQLCILLLPWLSVIITLRLFHNPSSHAHRVHNKPPPRAVFSNQKAPSRIHHTIAINDSIKLHTNTQSFSTFSPLATWQNSTVLPTWIKDYFDWHQQERAKLSHSSKFLILKCLQNDTRCGGTADRLQPLPFALMIAARTRRLLLIHWERPCQLEEFLVPPLGGIDWRLPTILHNYTFPIKADLTVLQNILPHLQQSGNNRKPLPRIATMLYQSHGHGAEQYNQLKSPNEPTYEQVFRDIWKAFFIPSLPIQTRIQQCMQVLHLKSNDYVAVHIRSRYHSYNNDQQLRTLVRHALNCASHLQTTSSMPIYVATDDAARTTPAAMKYGTKRGATIVARSQQAISRTLHLDRGTSFLSKNASHWTFRDLKAVDYYDTFVDLYLLAESKCIAYHVGNYGKWANLLSANRSCHVNYLKDTCPWKGD